MMRAVRFDLWRLVRWVGDNVATFGQWLYWRGKAGQARNRYSGGEE